MRLTQAQRDTIQHRLAPVLAAHSSIPEGTATRVLAILAAGETGYSFSRAEVKAREVLTGSGLWDSTSQRVIGRACELLAEVQL